MCSSISYDLSIQNHLPSSSTSPLFSQPDPLNSPISSISQPSNQSSRFLIATLDGQLHLFSFFFNHSNLTSSHHHLQSLVSSHHSPPLSSINPPDSHKPTSSSSSRLTISLATQAHHPTDHSHHQHSNRKASATVSVSGSGLFDSSLSPRSSFSLHSPSSQIARKQSIDCIWQGAHQRPSLESAPPHLPSPIVPPTPSSVIHSPIPEGRALSIVDSSASHNLYHLLTHQLSSHDTIVHLQILDHLIQPWEQVHQPHEHAALALTRNGLSPLINQSRSQA